MNILYIGQNTDGTTSEMRASRLKNILKPITFDIIDIHVPFYKTKQPFRSIGFRYKIGPLIMHINDYVIKKLKKQSYDIIWVDKGVYLKNNTIKKLRSQTKRLVHFTPDPAFTFHQSKLFNRSIDFYDYLITTKSFELDQYYKKKSKKYIILVTQGFDKNLHKPKLDNLIKKSGLLFIGHHELQREQVIEKLINNGITVKLAGIKWDKFYSKHKNNINLVYLGNGIYGENYVKEIQNSKIAWGAISKWIPELHTTRTFEIPACGTALLTERNKETSSFFQESEVIFYDSIPMLIEKVKFYLKSDIELARITENGLKCVVQKGFDYDSILSNVIETIMS